MTTVYRLFDKDGHYAGYMEDREAATDYVNAYGGHWEKDTYNEDDNDISYLFR